MRSRFAVMALAFLALLGGAADSPANTPPVISNVYAVQFQDNSGKVSMTFDLDDAEGDLVGIDLYVLSADGQNVLFHCQHTDPSPGSLFSPGQSRTVIWDAGLDYPGYDGNVIIRVMGDDQYYTDCFLTRDYIHQVAATGDCTAYDVSVQGDVVLVAAGSGGLRAYRLNSSGALQALDALPLPGDIRCLYVSGGRAYIGDYGGQFFVADVSDPANLQSLGSATVGNYPVYAVALQGQYAYLVMYRNLEVYDVSSPASPVRVALLSLASSSLLCLAVRDDVLYCGTNSSGIVVVDIADPLHPSIITTLAGSGNHLDLLAQGDYLYAGCRGSVFSLLGYIGLYDITTPSSPVPLGNRPTDGHVVGLADWQGRLAAVSSSKGIILVDEGAGLMSGDLVSAGTGGLPYGLAVSGPYAVVADGSAGVSVFDLTKQDAPDAPVICGAPETIYMDVQLVGTRAYIARSAEPPTSGFNGIQVYDVSDPCSITWLGSCSVYRYTTGVTVADQYAYVSIEGQNTRIYDVADPAHIQPVSTIATPGGASDIAVSGTRAYVGDLQGDLKIVDVSNPALPVVVSTMSLGSVANGIAVAGDRLYASLAGNAFAVIDVGDPAHPSLLGSVSTPSRPYAVVAEGLYCYTVASNQLYVVNVADPGNPVLAATINCGYSAYDLSLYGGYLYVTNHDKGVEVFDISVRADPKWVFGINAKGSATTVSADRKGILFGGDQSYVQFTPRVCGNKSAR